MLVLQPQMMKAVEIQVVVPTVVRERVSVFPTWIDIGKVVAIEEIDLPHRRNDKASGLRTVDGLRTIVGQTVGGVIYVETFVVCLDMQTKRQADQHHCQPYLQRP